MQHREGCSIVVSKKSINQGGKHVLLKILIPNLSRKITLRMTLWCFLIRISEIDFLTAQCSKLTNNLLDTFVHFNLNSAVLVGNCRMTSQENIVPFMLNIRPNKPQSLSISKYRV